MVIVGQSLCPVSSSTLNFGNAVKLDFIKPLLRERVCFPTTHFFRDRVKFELRKKEEAHGRWFVFFQGHNAVCSLLPDTCTSGEIIADKEHLQLERKPKVFDKSLSVKILFVVIMYMCQKLNLVALLAYYFLLPLLLDNLADDQKI